MKHYSKECPNLPTLPKENVNSYTWKFYVEEKGKVQILIFLLDNEILIALMKKINENLIIQNLTLMEQKLMRDVILKESVFEMCGNIFVVFKMCGSIFVLIKNHLQCNLKECPHIFACVLKILFGENWKKEVGILEITI